HGRTGNGALVVAHHIAFVVAGVGAWLEDAHALFGELRPAQPADQFLGLAAEHAAADHLDPALAVLAATAVFEEHGSTALDGRAIGPFGKRHEFSEFRTHRNPRHAPAESLHPHERVDPLPAAGPWPVG